MWIWVGLTSLSSHKILETSLACGIVVGTTVQQLRHPLPTMADATSLASEISENK